MTDVPISPCLGIRGKGGGTQAPCRTKRPLGLQRKVTDPYCVCFRAQPVVTSLIQVSEIDFVKADELVYAIV